MPEPGYEGPQAPAKPAPSQQAGESLLTLIWDALRDLQDQTQANRRMLEQILAELKTKPPSTPPTPGEL